MSVLIDVFQTRLLDVKPVLHKTPNAAALVPENLLSVRISAGYVSREPVLRNLALDVRPGEILGLVGQSGCGKSTLALAILKLLHLKHAKASGSILLNGRDLMPLKERAMRSLRGREIGLVLQSPMSALNPALRIGSQLVEALQVHRKSRREEAARVLSEAMENVSLPSDPAFLRRYPSQLSVGQAQRVLIAMAILHRPALLIADEPTSALDLITQAEILQLFSDLNRKLGMSILYISHDLLSVATISNRIAVMERGEIVECRKTADLFHHPENAYTKKLIAALPVSPLHSVPSAGSNADSSVKFTN
jgi:ABC-type dipeptide/oligopeptide/nickel transport system ATPase component